MAPVLLSYKVTCPNVPAGGSVTMELKLAALRIVLRVGAPTNFLRFFCLRCREEHCEDIGNAETRRLIKAGVGFDVVRVPAEALETHLPAPLSPAWVDKQLSLIHI